MQPDSLRAAIVHNADGVTVRDPHNPPAKLLRLRARRQNKHDRKESCG
jgi:hypothetical protein